VSGPDLSGPPGEGSGSVSGADLASLFRLDGKVALITGASAGIGARLARVLHAAGAQVVLTARRVDRLTALAQELPGSVAIAADLADPASVAAMVDAALMACGRIDVLVNNAGLDIVGPAETQPLEDFRRVVDVNLVGLFHVTQLVARSMLERESGVVVNLSSILGLVSSAPIPSAAYAASKAAVVNLTRELAVQWAGRGVRVNAIAPGWFPTEMTDSMFEDERSMTFVRRNTPMGRPGEPDELDGAVLYLASEASTFVTGHTLVVDGGWTAR
jgi:NAD(P)-dependent dehydrogenase (short-subunit alcohol dehydrogenase family)